MCDFPQAAELGLGEVGESWRLKLGLAKLLGFCYCVPGTLMTL